MNAPHIHHGISLTTGKRIAFYYLIDVRPKPADTTASQSSSSSKPTSHYPLLNIKEKKGLARVKIIRHETSNVKGKVKL
jgi:hypothetical protein